MLARECQCRAAATVADSTTAFTRELSEIRQRSRATVVNNFPRERFVDRSMFIVYDISSTSYILKTRIVVDSFRSEGRLGDI